MTGKVPRNQTEYDLETAISAAIKIAFLLPHGRGDQVRNGGSGPDLRELPAKGLRTRDIYIPDLHIDTIRVKSRDS